MLDQSRLNAIRLRKRPLAQRLVGTLFLTPNFNLPFRRTRIVLEGVENLPRSGCILVMNHTDRYNYWPLQYRMWREGHGFTATWAKGKYYENRAVGWFLDVCNNIPLPSKGFVLTKDFLAMHGRPPRDEEYAALKNFLDGKIDQAAAGAQAGENVAALLGRSWSEGSYKASLEARFLAMMARVLEITREGLALGLKILIFPQGTRSVQLTPGHVGAAQIILDSGAPVVPIGSNGSEKCYPGSSPWSRGGRIVYRIGKPLTIEGELAPFRIDAPFVPFTPSADAHRATFRRLTDLLMERIDALLDPQYRFDPTARTTTGAQRFV